MIQALDTNGISSCIGRMKTPDGMSATAFSVWYLASHKFLAFKRSRYCQKGYIAKNQIA
jgi:hypothetical protein